MSAIGGEHDQQGRFGGVTVALLLVGGAGRRGGGPGVCGTSGHCTIGIGIGIGGPSRVEPRDRADPHPAGLGAPEPSGNPGRCTTAELAGSLGPAEGAAGSVIRALLLTNNSGRTCELTGFPGVSYVAGDRSPVLPAHARTGLRVYPPGDTASLFVPAEGTGCAGSP